MRNTATKCEHTDRIVHGRGLCGSCYQKYLLENNSEYRKRTKLNNSKRHAKNFAKHKHDKKSDFMRAKRSRTLKMRYGITLDDYEMMLKNQNHSCACCGLHEKDFSQNLYVDHCHDTGKVRGLVCAKCNTAAGIVDDKELLKKVILYLNEDRISLDCQ